MIIDILDGRRDAYAVLINRYQRPIFNMLLRMVGCREDASDLLQDTFIRAYENLERFKLGARFFPWLYTIGMNAARDHLRRKKTAADACEPSRMSHGGQPASPEPSTLDRVDAGRLPGLLARLPVDYREALILRFHQGWGMRDIGRALGISTSGAKMRVSRGLAKLRKMIEDPNGESDREHERKN